MWFGDGVLITLSPRVRPGGPLCPVGPTFLDNSSD